jgi:hypothetical protein
LIWTEQLACCPSEEKSLYCAIVGCLFELNLARSLIPSQGIEPPGFSFAGLNGALGASGNRHKRLEPISRGLFWNEGAPARLYGAKPARSNFLISGRLADAV